jgi:hypothetical protein
LFCDRLLIFLSDIELLIKAVHLPHVNKDQNDKDVNGSLLGKPETQLEAEEVELIEEVDDQDAKDERNQEPDTEQYQHQPEICAPVAIVFVHICSPVTKTAG